MMYFWVWSGLQQDLVVLEQQGLVVDHIRPDRPQDFQYLGMNEHPIGAMKV